MSAARSFRLTGIITLFLSTGFAYAPAHAGPGTIAAPPRRPGGVQRPRAGPVVQITQFNLDARFPELVSADTQVVKWNATDANTAQVSLQINLYFSDDFGASFKLVAFDLANPATGDGTFDWFVPNRPSTGTTGFPGIFRVEAVNFGTNMTGSADSTNFRIRSENTPNAIVGTNLRDFDMPGTQPALRGTPIADPANDCANCHASNAATSENYYRRWKGTMMGNASIDPLFDACLVLANKDAPESGDLCIRCHVPKGWVEGRSSPTDGRALRMEDKVGVSCEFCHRMVDPLNPGSAPRPPSDAAILAALGANRPMFLGNGMYVIDPNYENNAQLDRRRGPFDIAGHGGHETAHSGFFGVGVDTGTNDTGASAHCGTCHDVSNPVFEVARGGNGQPLSPRSYTVKSAGLGVAQSNFDPNNLFPIERTYSEWFFSSFRTGPISVPGFPNVKDCSDCHMKKAESKRACGGGDLRTLHEHDHTGGNTFITRVFRDAAEFLPFFANDAERKNVFGGMGAAPNNNGSIDRALVTLKKAAELDGWVSNDLQTLYAKVTNNTGHKLPTGYPEGRRMWLNVKLFYSNAIPPIKEFGDYNTNTADLNTSNTRVYEADLVTDNINGIANGSHFHFVLGNKIKKDNRIPPRGFSNAAFDAFGGKPIDPDPPFNGNTRYPDGHHWDITPFAINDPNTNLCPDYAEIRLYYQTSSKEYVEFLRDNANAGTNNAGQRMYNLWAAHGKSEPVEMAFKRVDFPAIAPDLISAESVKTHGTGQNAIAHALLIDTNSNASPRTTEPRDGGMTELLLTFDQPVVPPDGSMPSVVVMSTRLGTFNPVVQGFGNNVLSVSLPASNEPDCLKITVQNLMGECNQQEIETFHFYVRNVVGDTNGNGVVSSGDVAQVYSVLGQSTVAGNYRMDLNLDGQIDQADWDLVRMQSGQCQSPPCP